MPRTLSAAALLAAVLCAPASALVLSGDRLLVGVDDSGLLIDPVDRVGLKLDPRGQGRFDDQPDLLLPGIPFTMASIGLGGSWQAAGYGHGNAFGMLPDVVPPQGGASLLAFTGRVGDLGLRQTLAVEQAGGTLRWDLQLTNLGDEALAQLAYATGLDADPDFQGFGRFDTRNRLGTGSASASGVFSGLQLTLRSLGPAPAVASVVADWPAYDPYALLLPRDDGDGDFGLFLAWDLGTLAPGQTASLSYELAVTPAVPEPQTAAMLLAGLLTVALVASRRSR